MTKAKLIEDSLVLHRFITLYCEHKHDMLKNAGCLNVSFQGEILQKIPYILCEECEKTLLYAYQRLEECPYHPKPSCRKCHTPCYEKPMWKKMASIMMYSGMRLGLSKIRKFFSK